MPGPWEIHNYHKAPKRGSECLSSEDGPTVKKTSNPEKPGEDAVPQLSGVSLAGTSPQSESEGETSENESGPSSPASSTSSSSRKKKRPKSKHKHGAPKHTQSGKGRVKVQPNFKDGIIKRIMGGHYRGAIRFAMEQSSLASRHFYELVSHMAMSQMTKFVKKVHLSMLGAGVNRENMENFEWKDAIEEFKQHLPVLHAVLSACLTTKSRTHRVKISADGKCGELIPGMAKVLSMVCKMRSTKFNLIPTMMGMSLYKNGCGTGLLDSLSSIGLCHTSSNVRSTIDKCGNKYDQEIMAVKSAMEAQLSNDPSHAMRIPPEETLDHSVSQPHRTLQSDSDDSEMQSTVGGADQHLENLSKDSSSSTAPDEPAVLTSHSSNAQRTAHSETLQESSAASGGTTSMEEKSMPPGYTISWDNVQKAATCRHEKGVKLPTWALAFATINRVPSKDFTPGYEGSRRAQDMELQELLPRFSDWTHLRDYMEVMVSRMITAGGLPSISAIADSAVVEHIEHQYSEESSKKSRIINLGLIKADPSSAKGFVEVMKRLNHYVPRDGDNILPVCVNGDELSAQHMSKARRVMGKSSDPVDRMAGLEPMVQQYHQRIILLQDYLDNFYKSTSGSQRGTLYNLRDQACYKNIQTSAALCVNDLMNFLRFVTESFACLSCMNVLGMRSWEDVPKGCPSPEAQKRTRMKYISQISRKVVDDIWPDIDHSKIEEMCTPTEGKSAHRRSCTCNGDEGEEWIECSGRQNCVGQRWYHNKCMNLRERRTDKEDDWWCSQTCKLGQYSIFCTCKRVKGGKTMVECSRGSKCVASRWYHLECVRLSSCPVKDWFCCTECHDAGSRKGDRDGVQAYSKAMLWHGLFVLANIDAERENNGPEMIRFWKLCIPSFWEKNHPQYLEVAHRLIAGMNGWFPSRLAHDAVWNRTANITGGPGRNIALDLIRGSQYNEFKSPYVLNNCRGGPTLNHLTRVGCIAGNLDRSIRKMFTQQEITRNINSGPTAKPPNTDDVVKCLKVLQNDHIFKHIRGRFHKDFPSMTHRVKVANVEGLKKKLSLLSRNLDNERKVLTEVG